MMLSKPTPVVILSNGGSLLKGLLFLESVVFAVMASSHVNTLRINYYHQQQRIMKLLFLRDFSKVRHRNLICYMLFSPGSRIV